MAPENYYYYYEYLARSMGRWLVLWGGCGGGSERTLSPLGCRPPPSLLVLLSLDRRGREFLFIFLSLVTCSSDWLVEEVGALRWFGGK